MAELPVKTKAEVEPPRPLIIKMMEWVAWPLSIGVGWWLGHDAARNSLYDTLKHSKKFKEARMGLQKPGEMAVAGHWGNNDTIITNALTAAEASKKSVHINPLLREERRNFNSTIKKYFRQLGYHNTANIVGGIDTSEAIKAGMIAFGGAAFTLGAILTLAESKTLQRLFSRKENADEQSIHP